MLTDTLFASRVRSILAAFVMFGPMPAFSQSGCINVGPELTAPASGTPYKKTSIADAHSYIDRTENQYMRDRCRGCFNAKYPAGTKFLPVLEASHSAVVLVPGLEAVLVFEPSSGYALVELEDFRAAGGKADDSPTRFATSVSSSLDNATRKMARGEYPASKWGGGETISGFQGDKLYISNNNGAGFRIGEKLEVQKLVVSLRGKFDTDTPLEWKAVKVGTVTISELRPDGVVVGRYVGQPPVNAQLRGDGYRVIFENAIEPLAPKTAGVSAPCLKEPPPPASACGAASSRVCWWDLDPRKGVPITDLEKKTQADGHWIDTRTKLMWIAKDRGILDSQIGSAEYCSQSRVLNQADWRLPTVQELTGLFDPSKLQIDMSGRQYHIAGGIMLSGQKIWTSTPGPRDNHWLVVMFGNGGRQEELGSGWNGLALCTRDSRNP
ncbi:MAG TPA: DUF1566 domain-containing protein [Bryobacteraceae bacterium]|jgi:hypothetical protein